MKTFKYIPSPNYAHALTALSKDLMLTWEKSAMQKDPWRELVLMEIAGKYIADFIIESARTNKKKIAVFCGPGNNGGDGYVIARYLKNAGFDLAVYASHAADTLDKAAKSMAQSAQELQIPVMVFEKSRCDTYPRCDVIVDALLGTGVTRDVEGKLRDMIDFINRSNAVVVSVDLPSGLGADDGKIHGIAVEADYTLSPGCVKVGQLIAAGPLCCGMLKAYDIGLPPPPDSDEKYEILYDYPEENIRPFERPPDTHKYQCGHVACIGGSSAMSGALNLAASAALRAGSGLVTAFFVDQNVAQKPEIMSHALSRHLPDKNLFKKYDVIACGPGLGRDPFAQNLLRLLLDTQTCLVLDADALHGLRDEPINVNELIITPHPGEAAALLSVNTEDIMRNPIESARKLAQKYNGVVILKSHTTVVCRYSGRRFRTALSPHPNPRIAGPGFGDTLTGIVAAQLAQRRISRLSAFDACCRAVLIHAVAARHAAARHGNAVIASDLENFIIA